MQELKSVSGTIQCEAILSDIAVNPTTFPLPMDGHRRSEEEIRLWRRRPYILGEGNKWKLFCLQQCGFRLQLRGTFETLDDAISEALADHMRPEYPVNSGDLDF